MIFVTGDTHGLQDFNKLHIFAGENNKLTKNDYVIIAGDFGALWNENTLALNLRAYSQLPFTILFVDGNHENFNLLNTYPVEQWHGGKVHKIKPDIIHLMRGQVFEIDGKTIFTFGGATSIDKHMRIEGLSWWREELPDDNDLSEAVKNLSRYKNNVDYVITHSCGERALTYPPLKSRNFQTGIYPENRMLSYFEDTVKFKHWYFGHYHLDGKLNDGMTVLYHNIIKVE